MKTQARVSEASLDALFALAVLLERNDDVSLQEWADEFGCTYGGLMYHVRVLVQAGYVERVPGRHRATQITRSGRRALGG